MEIKTEVKFLFNCVLEKADRECRREISDLGIKDEVYMGYNKNGLKIDCLAFTNDMKLDAESVILLQYK